MQKLCLNMKQSNVCQRADNRNGQQSYSSSRSRCNFYSKTGLKRTFIDYRGFLVFCEDNESPILTSNNGKSRIGITERVLMVA
jgi:hypothetical protein